MAVYIVPLCLTCGTTSGGVPLVKVVILLVFPVGEDGLGLFLCGCRHLDLGFHFYRVDLLAGGSLFSVAVVHTANRRRTHHPAKGFQEPVDAFVLWLSDVRVVLTSYESE